MHNYFVIILVFISIQYGHLQREWVNSENHEIHHVQLPPQ